MLSRAKAQLADPVSIDSPSHHTVIPPYRPKLRTQADAPRIYQQQRAQLAPIIDDSNWLRPRVGDSLPVAVDESANNEQLQRLLYYQSQLARQEQELRMMGIQLPAASVRPHQPERHHV
jgi:hypothetical protein